MKSRCLALLLSTALFFAGAIAGAEDQKAADTAGTSGATAESATLFPVPEYAGGLGDRLFLTGDWGGARTDLANHGFQAKLTLTQVYQGIWSGGKDTRPEYGGWTNLELDFDLQKLGLWPGGFLMIRADANWAESINPHTGALIPANTNAMFPVPGQDEITLSHVVYTQFLSEWFGVFLGKLDTTSGDMNDFAHGRGDRQFMNTAFGFNPATALTTPYSTLGAGFAVLPTPDLQLTFTVFDTNGTAAASGFDTAFEGNNTYAAEGRLKTRFFGHTGHQVLGAAYSNDAFTDLTFATDINIPRFGGHDPIFTGPVGTALRLIGLPDGLVKKNTGTWNAYYNFDQYLVESAEDATQGFGLFGRFGAADGGTNPVEFFYSLGFGGKGMIPGRANDSYGVGWYYMQTSNDIPDVLKIGDEQGFEAYYTFAVTPWLQLTPDLQLVNPARQSNATTLIAGVRCNVVF